MVASSSLLSLRRRRRHRRRCAALLAVAACVTIPGYSSSFSFGVVCGPPSSSSPVRRRGRRHQNDVHQLTPRGGVGAAVIIGSGRILPTAPESVARAVVHLSAARRYGPPPDETTTTPTGSGPEGDFDIDFNAPQGRVTQQEWQRQQRRHRDDFRRLLDRIVVANDPSHVPSLLTRHMDTILAVLEDSSNQNGNDDDDDSTALWLESLLHDAQVQHGETAGLRMAEALDSVVQCAEEFVAQAKSMEEEHQALLGRILRLASDKTSVPSSTDREDALDKLLDETRESLTPGFLRHLERECDRIAAAPILTPASARLSELLCVVRARIVEELGRNLGEVAQVLGSLASCDDPSERKALVDAAVAVRGSTFARDLASAADEALEGFRAVPAASSAGEGVDPDLVHRVQEIRDRVRYHHS